jgi:hypothetical protein
MTKRSLVLILLAVVIGFSACGNHAIEPDSTLPESGTLAVKPPPTTEETGSVAKRQIAIAPIHVSNRTSALVVSEIGICNGSGGRKQPVAIPNGIESGGESLGKAQIPVAFPSVYFRFQYGDISGDAILPNSLRPPDDGLTEVSVVFTEEDALFAEVHSRSLVGVPAITVYRYDALLDVWIEVQEGQRLFAVRVKREELKDYYPGAQWDSYISPTVFFCYEPIYDLKFIAKESDYARYVIKERVIDEQYDTLLPGRQILKRMDNFHGIFDMEVYARYRDKTGVEHVQIFRNNEIGGMIPSVSSDMVDESVWRIERVFPLASGQPGKAFEMFSDYINIDEDCLAGIKKYGSDMEWSQLNRIENLDRYGLSGEYYLIVPRFAHSTVILQRLVYDKRLYEYFPEEMVYQRTDTPEDYALVLNIPADSAPVWSVTVGNGSRNARYDFYADNDTVFMLPKNKSPLFEGIVFQTGNVVDIPLKNNSMLRFSNEETGAHEERRRIEVSPGNGEYTLLHDGELELAISPEKDKVAFIDYVGWEVTGDLFLYDTKTQISKKCKLELPAQHTPKWALWLDNKYLLVGASFAYGTVTVGGNIYAYDAENNTSHVLFDNWGNAQIRHISIEQDPAVISYVIWDDGYNKYTEKEITVSFEEIHALINAGETYDISK